MSRNYWKQCNKFYFLDDVQFNSRSWQQRNRILVNGRYFYLTVPVIKKGLRSQKINECTIKNNNFFFDHLKIIKHSYSRSKYFNDYYFELQKLSSSITNTSNLCEVNILIIKKILSFLKIKKKLLRSSDLNFNEKRSEKLIKIITSSKEKVYLSTTGSKKYLIEDLDKFKKKEIQVKILNFRGKPYKQLSPNFFSKLSILDLIFNLGDKASNYLDDCFSIETLE